MSNFFETYLSDIDNAELKAAITHTRDEFKSRVLSEFDDMSDRQVLLYGDVQSGKTSHMLGLMADALEANFETVIVLTSPNTRLIDQTYRRVFQSLPDVLVCKADSTSEFEMNQHRTRPKKSVVVLGKLPRILDKWIKLFRRTDALSGNPVLIVDDEADATSLNTKVNKNEISRINRALGQMRELATGCIYLQVTGTPQATFLQSENSGWKIHEAIHFLPGKEYVGGKFFFDNLPNPHVRAFPPSEEASDLALRDAVATHLVTSATFSLLGKETCNMLLHPSHLTETHFDYKTEVKKIVQDIFGGWNSDASQQLLSSAHKQLSTSFPDIPNLQQVLEELLKLESKFNYLAVNADEKSVEEDWRKGYNFIVGGNSLGRGLTFDYLQTVFYIRESSRPQADTVWQHARMFGYSRHKPTLRLFIPAQLLKMFVEVHEGNEMIKEQLENGIAASDLRVVLDGNVAPTRSNVLDRSLVGKLNGGVNYFAENPKNLAFQELDAKLFEAMEKHGDDFQISTKAASELTRYFETDTSDLDLATFRVALDHYAKEKPHITARVILRTDRKVSRGTGTLLSPRDQQISKEENVHPLLILYRISGMNSQVPGALNWDSDPIWVPNIRIPESKQFWRIDS